MLIAHPVAGKVKSQLICETFIAGAPKTAKGHVFYGVNETNVAEWDHVRDRKEDWYYIDNSYFDSVRGEQFRVTKNRVQVDPVNKQSDGSRFAALGLAIKPLQPSEHGLVVVIEQSPSFMRTVAKDPDWFHRELANLGDQYLARGWHNDKIKQQATLIRDLQGAAGLITHSSAAAVTALLEGVPTHTSRMSAVYKVDCPLRVLQVLADNQWTLNEMKAGVAWQWLNK